MQNLYVYFVCIVMYKKRNIRAIEIATECGDYDGADHKAWVIDQMVRILAGDKYDDIIKDVCNGEEGPDTYHWPIGTPP